MTNYVFENQIKKQVKKVSKFDIDKLVLTKTVRNITTPILFICSKVKKYY